MNITVRRQSQSLCSCKKGGSGNYGNNNYDYYHYHNGQWLCGRRSSPLSALRPPIFSLRVMVMVMWPEKETKKKRTRGERRRRVSSRRVNVPLDVLSWAMGAVFLPYSMMVVVIVMMIAPTVVMNR
jgi:hypothetical protein